MRKLIIVALAVCCSPAIVRAQEKDLAALFPAGAKGYVEITQIAELVKEFRGLIKGSVLEEPPGTMEKIDRRGRGFFYGLDVYSMYASFVGPEVLDEISRLKGGAIALLKTPNDLHQPPEFLAVLQTGDTNYPHITTRAMIGMFGLRTAETVEGVRVYRTRRFDGAPEDKEKPVPPKDDKFQIQANDPDNEFGEMQVSVALMPGAIVVGSKTKDVADAIRRLKGKEAGPTLASVPDFKQHAALREAPGMFLYADFTTLTVVLRDVFAPFNRGKRDFKRVPGFDDDKKPQQVNFQPNRQDDPWVDLLASLGSSFKNVALGLTVKNGTVELRGNIQLDTSAKSAWNEFFGKRTLNFELLNYVPRDSRLILATAMPEGMKFWDKLGKSAPVLETDLASLLTLIDVEKLQQVMLLDRQFVGEGIHREFFNFVVESKDANTAKSLGLAALRGKIKVESKGRFAALGQDAKGLAEILAAGSAQQGLYSDPKVARALKEHEGAHAVLVYSWGQKLADLARDEIRQFHEDLKQDKKRVEEDKKFEDKKIDGNVAFVQPKDKGLDPEDQLYLKHLERVSREFSKAVENVPPLVLSVTRKDDQLILLGRQSHLQGTMARVIDLLIESGMTRLGRFDRPDRPRPFEDVPKTEELKKEVK